MSTLFQLIFGVVACSAGVRGSTSCVNRNVSTSRSFFFVSAQQYGPHSRAPFDKPQQKKSKVALPSKSSSYLPKSGSAKKGSFSPFL